MPEIIMTCGTICCGKSTYAKKIQTERNAVILSIDTDQGAVIHADHSGNRMDCADRRTVRPLS